MVDLNQLASQSQQAQQALYNMQQQSAAAAARVNQAQAALNAATANSTAVNRFGMTQTDWNNYQKTIRSWTGNIDANGNAIQGSPQYYLWAKTGDGPNPGLGSAVNGSWGGGNQTALEKELAAASAALSAAGSRLDSAESAARSAKAAYDVAVVSADRAKNGGTVSSGKSGATANNDVNTKTSTAQKMAQNNTKVVSDKSGTRVATPTPGTSAKQSVAANQVKTSPTTTANKDSAAGKAATKAQTASGTSISNPTQKSIISNTKQAESAVKKSLATVVNTDAKLKVISVADQAALHKDEVQLKDGTWIPKVQKIGNREGEAPVVKVYSSTDYDKMISNAVDIQKKALEQYKQAQLDLIDNPLLDKSGMVINQVQGNGRNELGQNVLIEKQVGDRTDFYSSADMMIGSAMAQVAINNKTKPFTDDELGAFGIKSRFSNSSDVNQTAKNLNTDSKNSLFRASADLDNMVKSALSFTNVSKSVSEKISSADSKLSSYIPQFSDIIAERDVLLKSAPAPIQEFQKSGQKALYSNKMIAEAMNYASDKYRYGLSHPATTAALIGTAYAGGAAFGAAAEIGLGALGSAATTAAERAGLVTAAKYAEPAIRSVFNLVMGGDVVKSGAEAVKTGSVGNVLDFMGGLAIAGAGYGRGVHAIEEPINILPGFHEVKVNEVFPGPDAKVTPVHVGETFAPFGKSVISYDSKGLTLGNARLTDAKVAGKMVQPYSKLGTKSFDKYVDSSLSDLDKVYTFSGRNIASEAYNSKNPIIKPTKIEITSSEIPDKYKSAVKQSVVDFGKIGIVRKQGYQIYGSVAQKAFMGDYLTRTPKDLEISVKDTTKFTSSFKKTMAKKGFTEGKDYRIDITDKNAPKVEFKQNGEWKKGIEVFSHNPDVSLSESQGKKATIQQAFGFTGLKSAKVDNLKLMKLQEQAARKLSGVTNLKNGTIDLTHPGRLKDVRDLIDIGVGYKVERNIGSTKDIIAFAKAAAQKFPGLLDKKSNSYSPMIDYLVKNESLPSKSQIIKMGVELPETARQTAIKTKSTTRTEKELLFAKEARDIRSISDSLDKSMKIVKGEIGSKAIINSSDFASKAVKQAVQSDKALSNAYYESKSRSTALTSLKALPLIFALAIPAGASKTGDKTPTSSKNTALVDGNKKGLLTQSRSMTEGKGKAFNIPPSMSRKSLDDVFKISKASIPVKSESRGSSPSKPGSKQSQSSVSSKSKPSVKPESKTASKSKTTPSKSSSSTSKSSSTETTKPRTGLSGSSTSKLSRRLVNEEKVIPLKKKNDNKKEMKQRNDKRKAALRGVGNKLGSLKSIFG